MRSGLLLMLSIEARGDVVVKGKSIPGKPPIRAERGGDALERAAAVGPGRQVQERAERAVNERRRLVESEVAHVAFAQIKLNVRLGRVGVGLRKHCRRRIDADDSLASCLRD